MTDTKLLEHVAGIFDPSARRLHGLRRGGRWLVALPREPEAFSRALALYQPQRMAARFLVRTVSLLSRSGFRNAALARVDLHPVEREMIPPLAGVESGTCGVLLGSPEHRIPRAIVSYRMAGKWEVAKVAFGPDGAGNLEQEARALGELAPLADGVPQLLGLHRRGDATVLRMPYLTGNPIRPGDSTAAIKLLQGWKSDKRALPISHFPEWPAIQSALAHGNDAEKALEKLSGQTLVPVICHGDFARWNLRGQAEGTPVALDWEWGHADGMPGLDLVHFFLQDARLVRRRPSSQAIAETIDSLEHPSSRQYLAGTGWQADPILPIIASLAWKQGAGHQDNGNILETSVACLR